MWGLTWSAFRKEERYCWKTWEKRRKIRNLLVKIMQMGSIIQKLADEIELHGSYEKYCAWRDERNKFIFNFQDTEAILPKKLSVDVKEVKD